VTTNFTEFNFRNKKFVLLFPVSDSLSENEQISKKTKKKKKKNDIPTTSHVFSMNMTNTMIDEETEESGFDKAGDKRIY